MKKLEKKLTFQRGGFLVLAGMDKHCYKIKTTGLKFNGKREIDIYICGPDQKIPMDFEIAFDCYRWLKIYDESGVYLDIKNEDDRHNYGGIPVFWGEGDRILIKIEKKEYNILR